jgi:recombination protein RecT
MPVETKAITLSQRISEPVIRARFNEVLGKKAAGFVSSVLSAVKTNGELSKCPPDSVISAAMIAATLDLPINPSLGFAYIVPYKDKGIPKAQFQMGWKGYNQLGLRSGQFARMNASALYKGELIKWDRVTGEFLYDLSKQESGEIIGYVSYFRLSNGYEHYLYMTVDEIKAHANKYSPSFRKGYGVWKDNLQAMCLKTVHKLNIAKWAPMTQDMELALNLDQAAVRNPVTVLDGSEGIIPEYPDNEDENQNSEVAEEQAEPGPDLTEEMSMGDPGTHQGYNDQPKEGTDMFPGTKTGKRKTGNEDF